MAAYEKQQQQQPHMSAPYYAYPAPPQPAYYAPPPPPAPAPRRSGSSCFLCFIFKIIAIVVVLLGAATIVLWLILRPGAVRATAASATLSRFDLADGGPAGGRQLLQYNLTVDIRVRNPNRFRIRYDYAEALASYDGDRFGYDTVEPFYLERRSERTVTAAFAGSSPVDGGGALRTYRREKGDGFYYVKVRLYADLAFKVRAFRARRKSKISCTLRLPVPNASATPVTTQLGTRCDVDF